jgi:hypothetical protein
LKNFAVIAVVYRGVFEKDEGLHMRKTRYRILIHNSNLELETPDGQKLEL